MPGIVDDQTLGRTGDRLIGAGIFIDNVEEDEGNEVLEEMAPVKQKVYLNTDRKLRESYYNYIKELFFFTNSPAKLLSESLLLPLVKEKAPP